MQNIMRDEDKNAKLYRGGDGALSDAWIGHIQIHPAKGKREIGGIVCAEASLIGASLRDFVPDSDFNKVGRRPIDPKKTLGHSHHDTVHALYAGTANYDDWKNRVQSKRHFSQPPRHMPSDCTKRSDLYDIFHFNPVDSVEAARNAHRWEEDTYVNRKLPVAVPGRCHPSTGMTSHLHLTLLRRTP